MVAERANESEPRRYASGLSRASRLFLLDTHCDIKMSTVVTLPINDPPRCALLRGVAGSVDYIITS